MKKISMILGLAALTFGMSLTMQAQFQFPGQQFGASPGQQSAQNPAQTQTKPAAFYCIGAMRRAERVTPM